MLRLDLLQYLEGLRVEAKSAARFCARLLPHSFPGLRKTPVTAPVCECEKLMRAQRAAGNAVEPTDARVFRAKVAVIADPAAPEALPELAGDIEPLPAAQMAQIESKDGNDSNCFWGFTHSSSGKISDRGSKGSFSCSGNPRSRGRRLGRGSGSSIGR